MSEHEPIPVRGPTIVWDPYRYVSEDPALRQLIDALSTLEDSDVTLMQLPLDPLMGYILTDAIRMYVEFLRHLNKRAKDHPLHKVRVNTADEIAKSLVSAIQRSGVDL